MAAHEAGAVEGQDGLRAGLGQPAAHSGSLERGQHVGDHVGMSLAPEPDISERLDHSLLVQMGKQGLERWEKSDESRVELRLPGP